MRTRRWWWRVLCCLRKRTNLRTKVAVAAAVLILWSKSGLQLIKKDEHRFIHFNLVPVFVFVIFLSNIHKDKKIHS
ncbi:hypothetical protein VNO80_04107 [Phaseolus coccineus]|uniref:Uncharacterized protein n=1 Tax=Phaseolus coccineus TaxID=3886 RepID=A0AAN9NT13_PHACN